MKVTKSELAKLASKKEVSRVAKKLQNRERTKIELSTGEIAIVSKAQGGFELSETR